jgi:hypothetical protein
MAKEWIENLATEIKQKNREAAEEFGRQQHQADVIGSQGRVFFADMVRSWRITSPRSGGNCRATQPRPRSRF